MKSKSIMHCLLILAAVLMSNTIYAQKYRILVFSKTAGFHHESITVGVPAIQKLGIENKFGVDTTTDSTQFTPLNLKKYAAIVFLNTTGNVLGEEEQKAFEQYIKGGGGYVGVHSATDTEYDWAWYGKLAGAYFLKHPAQQMADLHVINRKSIATKHLPATWSRKDEWYNFKEISPDLKVLIELDESTYTGGTNGAHHPMAWYHNYDGGRAFYTGLGHVDASYTDPLFLKHLLGGIQYAMGQKRME
ncbi:ThuA domain-containing protein [Pedobacter westerhofensis]|nr:ThuA domain-containing protein [Pedobacter westerhofensis]